MLRGMMLLLRTAGCSGRLEATPQPRQGWGEEPRRRASGSSRRAAPSVPLREVSQPQGVGNLHLCALQRALVPVRR